MRLIRPSLFCLAAALALAGCKSQPDVDITRNKAMTSAQTKPRSEPIFYNGKTYRLDYSYVPASNAFDMRVSGMGAKQRKDAVAVATSGLRYYSCTDRQKSQMIGEPSFTGGVWKLQARCA